MDYKTIAAWIVMTMLLLQAGVGIFGMSGRIRRKAHILLGLILLPLTFAHAWVAMMRVSLKTANMTGLWLATVALLLLAVQVLLGIALVRPGGLGSLKKAHLAVGLGILLLAGVHVYLVWK